MVTKVRETLAETKARLTLELAQRTQNRIASLKVEAKARVTRDCLQQDERPQHRTSSQQQLQQPQQQQQLTQQQMNQPFQQPRPNKPKDILNILPKETVHTLQGI
jgi:hypothetical protein